MRMVFRGLAVALALSLPAAIRAADAPVTETTTRALLDALEEREMPDVVLWVLDRVTEDANASPALKKEAQFRRANALVGVSRTEGDPAKKAKMLDDAEKQIDAFLAESPEGALAITAYNQKANLLLERGLRKVEAAKRPNADSAALTAEALAFFDAAIKSLKGTVKPGEEIKAVTNAEDAVLKEFRSVKAQVDALKPKAAEKEGDKPKKPARLSAKEQKRLDALEADLEQLQGKLLQTRLMTASAIFEKSRAYPAGSKEWATTIEESGKLFKALADKYQTKAAGVFARFYEGRNAAVLALAEYEKSKAPDYKPDPKIDPQKRLDAAIATLAPIVGIEDRTPVAISLRAKAIGLSLEAWLAQQKYGEIDEEMLKFALLPADRLPNRVLDADWLALKYRMALMLDRRADSLEGKDRGAKGQLQRDAKKLATEVATENREFAKEARELAAKLGKDVPVGEQDVSFAGVFADAGVAFTTFQDKFAAVKKLQAEGKADEAAAATEAAAPDRERALKLLQDALKVAVEQKADDAQINQARSMITYLLYVGKQYREAAEMGSTMVVDFPNAMGSKTAGQIALACWQTLAKEPDPSLAQDAKAKLLALAGTISRTWPAEPVGGDALGILLDDAINSRKPAAVVEMLGQLPKDSPKRAFLLLRAGTALWRDVQSARKLDAADRPDEKTIEGWKSTAKASLDEGLAAIDAAGALPAGDLAKVAVAAALTRVQIAIEDGDRAQATSLLEHKIYGPWTVVTGENAGLAQGSLAEGSLTVALRHFIETEQIDKAQQAMDALEKAASDPDRLTAMYMAMSQDLLGQLKTLAESSAGGDAGVRERAERILTGFEKFMEGVRGRDKKPTSQIWVATTYVTLGSGEGIGTVVPKAKAEQFLDRAAESYGGLLTRKEDPAASEEDRASLAKFEPSIRVKMASIFRARGKWDEAQQQIDWILADKGRQNSLDMQVQAADLLQSAGRAAAKAGDAAKAESLLREAVAGRKSGELWGWGGIAKRISRLAVSGTDEKALKAREQFFDARIHVTECLLERARAAGGDDRNKRLEDAKSSIATIRKLFPDLGGDATTKRFEKLLKEIQKEQGEANPRGFTQLEEEQAAATKQPAAAGASQ
jgi:hypothetical protein